MSSNGSPQLNCCRVPHLSPAYVPHETTTRASISPRAWTRIPPLRLIETLAPTRPPHPPSPSASRPHLSAESTVTTDPLGPQRQLHLPHYSPQPDRKYIRPAPEEASFKSLYPNRPHTVAPLPAVERGRSRYSTKTLQAQRDSFRIARHPLRAPRQPSAEPTRAQLGASCRTILSSLSFVTAWQATS